MSIASIGGEWAQKLVAQGTLAPQGMAVPASGQPQVQPPAAPAQTSNFEALTKYIPTETVTLFIAAMSAAQAINGLQGGTAAELRHQAMLLWTIYGGFAVLTPLIVLIVAYSGYVTARKALAAGTAAAPFRMPLFRMAAALVAFVVWALAVPGLLENPAGQIAASLGALIVSTFLSLLEPIFEG